MPYAIVAACCGDAFQGRTERGMSMSEWYYAVGQQRQGPVTGPDIGLLFQRGQLSLDSLVWREGMPAWAALRTVVDELQLQSLATAAEAPSGGIDLREDYAAIDNGTAPLPGTGSLGASPYAAPAAEVLGHAATVPLHGAEVVLAGFWKRLAAYLIDYAIVTLTSMVLGGIIGMVFGGVSSLTGAGMSPSANMTSQLLGGLVGLAFSVAYYGWFHASQGGATPGKLAIGIKVVRSSGERITLARSIGRYFATILSGLTLLIGYLMAAFTERKQALHDLMCDTIVVDKWAFTDQPQRQRRALGAVTVVVLVLSAVAFISLIVMAVAVIGTIAGMKG